MLKKITIKFYKGFYQPEEIEFAIPDKIKNGSGLTVIVGPNNTGKTTIIESLLLNEETNSKSFKEADRHPGKSPHICIEDKEGNKKSFTNLRQGSGLLVGMDNENNLNFQAELIPSRRYWQHQFSGESDTANLRAQSSNMVSIRSNNDFPLGQTLKFILKNPQKRKNFNKYLKLFIPHFTDWTVDSDEGGDFVKYKATNFYHRASLLGDGIISLFRIVAHITTENPEATFIIDEPELSLHPSAQKRLAEVISNLSKDKQVILCTHSPYFVSWKDFINGGKIVRLNKHKGRKCTVHKLDNTKQYSDFISKNIDEYQKPYLLDTVTKEILFSDKILFTEGQEDVGLIRSWLRKKRKENLFDIFGYGVGGIGNMKLFLEMSKDLGLEKVGALYDKNSNEFSSDKMKYPKYKIKKLPTDDIRDKKNNNGNIIKEGIFDDSGRIKAGFKDTFSGIMNEFLKFYNHK